MMRAVAKGDMLDWMTSNLELKGFIEHIFVTVC